MPSNSAAPSDPSAPPNTLARSLPATPARRPAPPLRFPAVATGLGLLLAPLSPQAVAQLSSAGSLVLSQENDSLAGEALPGEGFATALAIADVNGDGAGDLVLGVAGDRVDGPGDPVACGRLQIAYWNDGALDLSSQLLRLDDFPALGEACAEGDRFGAALAVGRFDDDPFPDVAIGIPGRAVGGAAEAGAVLVLRTGPSGPVASGALFLVQDDLWPGEGAEEFDGFGAVLAVGDFDGNTFDDLVVAAPGEDIATSTDAGAVHVIPGSATGLDPSSVVVLAWPDVFGQFGESGQSLAVGDFDGDGYDDLAYGSTHVEGRVFVAEGSPAGLSDAAVSSFRQDAVSGSAAESGDRFGRALAAGDFDRDGRDDLAIGAPSEDDDGSGLDQTGLVHVVYGSADGLQLVAGAPNVTFGAADVGATVSSFDRFGDSLAAGDFDADGADDLVIGAPLADADAFDDGYVATIPGVPDGSIDPAFAAWWRQGEEGLGEEPGNFDELGRALGVGRLGTEAGAELAIAAPGDDTGTEPPGGEGLVHVLFGDGGGLFADGFESGDTARWSDSR